MNSTCSCLIIILVCFYHNTLLAQKTSKVDSLEAILKTAKEDTAKVSILNSLCWQCRIKGDYEKGLQYCNTALALAETLNFKKGKGTSYNNIGAINNDQGNLNEALKNNTASLKIREETGDKANIATCYNNIGLILGLQGKSAEALKCHFTCLRISEEIGNKRLCAASFTNLGLLYETEDNYKEALKFHTSSLKLMQELNNKVGIAGSYANIGHVYDMQHKYDVALENHFASLKIMEELDNKRGIAHAYFSIALIYNHQGNYSEALKYNLDALKIREEIGAKNDLIGSYINLGDLSIRLNNFREARNYLERALALSKEIGNKDKIKLSYKALSDLDSAEGDFTRALHNYKQFTLYKDSIINEESKKQKAQLILQYETEKKDQQIQLLNKEREIKELEILKKQSELQSEQLQSKQKTQQMELLTSEKELQKIELEKTSSQFQKQKEELEIKKRQNELLVKEAQLQLSNESRHQIIRNSLAGATVLIIIIGLLLFNRYRIAQQQKHLSERMRISSDLHDEIGSTLSSIAMYSTFAKQKPAEVPHILEEISNSSQEMIDDMNDIIWTINPLNDSFKKIIERLRNYSSGMAQTKNIMLHFDSDDELYDIALSMEHRKNIFLICKEAINNAVKYSDCKNLYVKFVKKQKVLFAEVSDDGNGFETTNNGEGNGLKNMRKRAADMKAKISICSKNNSGTKINLEVKIV